jgi:indole-3-glycerol phosphate synthase
MNRKSAARKQTPKRTRKPAAAKPRAPKKAQAGAAVDEASAEYVAKFASAVSVLTEAQDHWVAEVDLVSRQPALMHDPQWQARSSASMNTMLMAANALRIEPVPEPMKATDELLARAQEEARTAVDGYSAAIHSSNARQLIAVMQRVDHMSQLIQEAYEQLKR